MDESPNAVESLSRSSSAPAALSATFLLLGLGFAFPIPLWPVAEGSLAVKSPATLNLHVLTAWMGLAHFVFAVTAQGRAFWNKHGVPAVAGFVVLLAVLWSVSCGLSAMLGSVWFDGLVWVYFIAHFFKAEHFFDRQSHRDSGGFVFDDVLPVTAFALFSVALIGRDLFYDRESWLLISGLALAGGALLPQGWRRLFDARRSTALVLAMFLIGEALVWGNYARFMSATFADGVYGFHVAAASFYHYVRAYAYPLLRPPADRWPGWRDILLVNTAIVGLGYLVGTYGVSGSNPVTATFNPVWDPRWFTVWVLWHLLTSDLARFVPRVVEACRPQRVDA